MATKPVVKVTITNLQFIDKEAKKRYDMGADDYRKALVFSFYDSKTSAVKLDYNDDKLMVEVRKAALEAALKQAGLAETKSRWSWKAGCSCGCSPAFIIDFRAQYDLYATYTVDSVVTA